MSKNHWLIFTNYVETILLICYEDLWVWVYNFVENLIVFCSMTVKLGVLDKLYVVKTVDAWLFTSNSF